ncbi:indole-3-glycerol phosphate synthase TrpC [Candidatus Poriferisodalis sp.]|uniref:indole-3-glycerol phosphate synthase TrpC n=1 Tax=Candidatus Poriferisodalis sp. TaxID=3101277 RepID=UPI003B02B2B8
MTSATYLDRIIAEHRAEASRDDRPLDALRRTAGAMPPPRPFRAALGAQGLSVVAEIKRRSPSKGPLFADLDPATLARSYSDGGAACLSVLTDGPNFGGSAEDLAAARSATALPTIRKDFTVSERDVLDARIMGADAVLLIAAALSGDEIIRFMGLARELLLDVLVETHDEAELESALAAGADLVGVNQRDLVTFEVDHERAARMGKLMPPEVTSVAESGVRGPDDAAMLADVGYDAVLVGESLVTSGDPAAAVAGLRTGALQGQSDERRSACS